RRERFTALLSSVVDARRVALFTLGPYARAAGPADLEKFVSVFTEFLTVVYAKGLLTYEDKPREVTGSTARAKDDVIVNIAVGDRAQPSSQMHIGFRVRRGASGQEVITDLEVEGVWLAIAKREEFVAYLQQHEGIVTKLSAEVAKVSDRLRAGLD